ncbi:hypothetical protein BD414DRAFT_493175 [Trametes punicea]|nr:hypothetical protein BD414DRAFT_493175 [Trametes punicea]
MHHHASLTPKLASLPLGSLFQAAAGRAWTRTRPTRGYHRTSVRSEGVASSTLRTNHCEYEDTRGTGEHSPSTSSATYAIPAAVVGGNSRVASLLPRTSASPRVPQVEDASPSSGVDASEASVRPASFHHLTRKWIARIDVERLSPQDYGTLHLHDSEPSAYESDPPWEEIRDSVPESLLPRIYLGRLPTSKQPSMIPNPTSPQDLVANLTIAITADPPAMLSRLLPYHAAHQDLHSTASFNLLIKFAIRRASFGTVKDLLGRMLHEGIPGDVETRALRVRSMVRTGYWREAWGEEMARMKEDGKEMPLPVWLEFFGEVKQGAIQVPPVTQGRKSGALQPPEPSVIAGRLDALMKHPPLVTPADLERVPPRVVYAIVRSFVGQGRRSAAAKLTAEYFATLPHDLDEEWQRSCLSIIHLHMKPGPKRNLNEHYAICKTLFGFLNMHHSFRPNSTTLFFLLGSLRWTRDCGKRADAVVRSFVKHWGPDMVDDAVRRRVASYWLRQRKVDRAQAVVDAQAALDEERVGWRAEKDTITGDTSRDRMRRLRWLDLHRSPRKNKEKFHWRLLRRRLRRAQVRPS